MFGTKNKGSELDTWETGYSSTSSSSWRDNYGQKNTNRWGDDYVPPSKPWTPVTSPTWRDYETVSEKRNRLARESRKRTRNRIIGAGVGLTVAVAGGVALINGGDDDAGDFTTFPDERVPYAQSEFPDYASPGEPIASENYTSQTAVTLENTRPQFTEDTYGWIASRVYSGLDPNSLGSFRSFQINGVESRTSGPEAFTTFPNFFDQNRTWRGTRSIGQENGLNLYRQGTEEFSVGILPAEDVMYNLALEMIDPSNESVLNASLQLFIQTYGVPDIAEGGDQAIFAASSALGNRILPQIGSNYGEQFQVNYANWFGDKTKTLKVYYGEGQEEFNVVKISWNSFISESDGYSQAQRREYLKAFINSLPQEERASLEIEIGKRILAFNDLVCQGSEWLSILGEDNNGSLVESTSPFVSTWDTQTIAPMSLPADHDWTPVTSSERNIPIIPEGSSYFLYDLVEEQLLGGRKLLCPVSSGCAITSALGVDHENQIGDKHSGVDFGNNGMPDNRILSPAPMYIVQADGNFGLSRDQDRSFGRHVVIGYLGIITYRNEYDQLVEVAVYATFSHMSESIDLGDTPNEAVMTFVDTGNEIGVMGHDGYSTGDHLHMQLEFIELTTGGVPNEGVPNPDYRPETNGLTPGIEYIMGANGKIYVSSGQAAQYAGLSVYPEDLYPFGKAKVINWAPSSSSQYMTLEEFRNLPITTTSYSPTSGNSEIAVSVTAPEAPVFMGDLIAYAEEVRDTHPGVLPETYEAPLTGVAGYLTSYGGPGIAAEVLVNRSIYNPGAFAPGTRIGEFYTQIVTPVIGSEKKLWDELAPQEQDAIIANLVASYASVEEQRNMSIEDILASRKYIGLVAPGHKYELGKVYILFGLSDPTDLESSLTVLGAVLCIDVLADVDVPGKVGLKAFDYPIGGVNPFWAADITGPGTVATVTPALGGTQWGVLISTEVLNIQASRPSKNVTVAKPAPRLQYGSLGKVAPNMQNRKERLALKQISEMKESGYDLGETVFLSLLDTLKPYYQRDVLESRVREIVDSILNSKNKTIDITNYLYELVKQLESKNRIDDSPINTNEYKNGIVLNDKPGPKDSDDLREMLSAYILLEQPRHQEGKDKRKWKPADRERRASYK